jgi:5-(carboxyamino)imidazole ribonucleotide synthase
MTKPAKILGILGGGQLGRMSALAAANLGIQTHIYTPEKNSPASQVAAKTIVGEYSDRKKLMEFAKGVDVISYEFENIPADTIRILSKARLVFPDVRVLETSQHRLSEKKFLNDCGIPTAAWTAARKPEDIEKTLKKWKRDQCVVKTTRFGYDGKGQFKYRTGDDIKFNWDALKSSENIIEDMIDFKCEISCIIARDRFGNSVVYDPVLNEHTNHILSKTIAPAPLSPALLRKAKNYIKTLAESLDLVGVLALELFVTKDGKILANEMAPRPHNSGHWTMDACAVSQFENHVRTVCGLPVGSAKRHSDAVMLNLIGDDIKLVDDYLEKSNACIHLYGKAETRPGRKMGHINILKKAAVK